MPRLEGKTALVTGATGAIGEATARSFLSEGANVMLVGRSAEKLDATRRRLGGTPKLGQFVADVVDEAATADSVTATIAAFGGVDVLFASAGTNGVSKPFEEQTLEEFEAVMRPNVTGVWLAMKHAVGPMRERGGGSMIAMSSIAGTIGFAGQAPYVASKSAVCGLVKTAALELGTSGIRVNAINPGPIDSRMMDSLAEQMAPNDPNGARAEIEGMIPMKRYGTSEEVANLAVFLASDESSYCTGGLYAVDGGYTAA
jgi:NAD(P)-dependent dehydrogenase (short-subunit alcohol dehydrogenase family)